MKPTDKQLKKLLQEQAQLEQQQLAGRDIDAYTVLFESLNNEREAQASHTHIHVADEVMAEIALIEERKDRRKDTITLVSAMCVGLLATAISYYFVDYPLLRAALFWLKTHFAIVAFVIIAICLIQFADKKLVSRH